MRISVRLRLVGLALQSFYWAFRRGLYTWPVFCWRVRGNAQARLVLAPQELRTADALAANEIYAGRFAFAGKLVMAGGRSPFRIDPPSREWAQALYGFGWLRHLRAAASPLARANARALVDEWIDTQGRGHPLAWQPDITARRVLAWLSQSPLVLEQADYAFYRKFIVSLTRQVNYLVALRRFLPPGPGRLQAVVALAQASLCFEHAGLQKRARAWLEAELKAQMLSDGGHASRHPGVMLQILLDLLPLRQTYSAQSVMPPPSLLPVIDRIIPLIRFFRHGDGGFALFNGMGPTPADVVATLLAYDETRGAVPTQAPASGYQRLQAGKSLVLADSGAAPRLRYASQAHAGGLSFEFSHAAERLVVNCGVPFNAPPAWRSAARRTAAHSTLEIDHRSRAAFLDSGLLARALGPLMVGNASSPFCERGGDDGAQRVLLRDDGYAGRFGVTHFRRLTLNAAGTLLDGEDTLQPVRGSARGDAPFVVRFHLHPAVKANVLRQGETVLLMLPSKLAFEFSAPGFEAQLEEGLYLGGAEGPRRAEQIVLRGRTKANPVVRWQFARCNAKQSEASLDETLPPLLL